VAEQTSRRAGSKIYMLNSLSRWEVSPAPLVMVPIMFVPWHLLNCLFFLLYLLESPFLPSPAKLLIQNDLRLPQPPERTQIPHSPFPSLRSCHGILFLEPSSGILHDMPHPFPSCVQGIKSHPKFDAYKIKPSNARPRTCWIH
jgi:hypothetical protein